MRAGVLLVAAGVLLVGCGDAADESGVGDATVVTAIDPGAGAGDVDPDAPGGRREVVPAAEVVNPTPTFVESYSMVDDDTVRLDFTMGVEDCYGLQKVLVDDAADAVTVTVLVGSKPGTDVCIELAELVTTVVDLPTPLAERPLVDASTGQPIPVA